MLTDAGNTVFDYSIIIPVYYNEGSLKTTMLAIKNDVIAKNPDLSCEIIFVDDGSGDGSLDELLEIRNENPNLIKIIKLTRNFGQPYARQAGLSYARGKCVVTMSADGQDPAALINDMLKAHNEEKYEIVICSRSGRDETWFRRFTSRLFYWLMKKLSFPDMPVGGYNFALLGRRVVEVLLRNQEAHPFFQGQILWTGYKVKRIEYRRPARRVGRSRWTFGKKLTLFIDAVMSYSCVPIRLISLVGISVALLGFIAVVVIFIRKLFWGTQVMGWAGLIIAVLVMGGVQMLMLGIIGEYLWRSLAQVRGRDPYIIEKIYDKDEII